MIGHQRIDTTQCNDLDDWYLDGFRDRKSFRSQKQRMFQNASNIAKENCQMLIELTGKMATKLA